MSNIEKRKFFEFTYFHPDSKYLKPKILGHIFSIPILLLVYIILPPLFVFFVVGIPILVATLNPIPLLIVGFFCWKWMHRNFDKVHLYEMQLIYEKTGVIQPQDKFKPGVFSLWDDVEKRRRYAANNFA